MNNSEPPVAKKVSLGSAIVGAIVTAVLGVIVGLNWSTVAANFLPYLGFSKTETSDWSELNEVYSELAANYDGDLDKSKLVEGAKKGMVEAVGDKYTVYMDEETASDFEDDLHGNVGAGIGVEMGERDGYVKVLRTLPDNPARAAGILAGDILYEADGEEVYEWDADKIAEKLRGEAGTEVTVTVVRDEAELNFTMTREEINNVSAYIEYDGQTAIITVTRFDTDTGTLVQSLVTNNDEFSSHNVNKVILDLRGNGGGYVSAAKDLLSLWMNGELALTQKSKNSLNDTTTYTDRGKATLANIKTAVLVNGSTASAAEITAGALQDAGKATIIGEQTYGKGVVQTLVDLSGNAKLKVTTAHWYTPKGNTINGTGITPDQVVERSFEDINAERDPQMDAAKAL